MRYISLFSGVAGLDRAIDALGGDCWVQIEKEPYCRSILDLRYPDVPKVDNIFGWHATADTVDLVVGGPPCQPVSHAGRRKGTEDERWLWGEALRVVAEAKPSRVFFENPMGLRTMGLDTVLDGLTELGYGGAWEVVAAADVGAPHLRKRIFIMGIAGREGWEGPTRPPGNRKVLWPSPNASGERPNEGNVRLLRQRVLAGDMTEAEASGMLNGKSVFEAQGKVPAWPTPTVPGGGRVIPEDAEWVGRTTAYHDGKKLQVGLESAVRKEPGKVPAMPTPTARLGGQRGPQAKRYFDPARSNDLDDYVAAYPAGNWPTPTSRDYKDTGDSIANGMVPVNGLLGRAVGPSVARGALSPDWVEWLMNLPIGWTNVNVDDPGPLYGWEEEPAIPRVGLGINNRSKRLTALGNAVVPEQAVYAWTLLDERLRGVWPPSAPRNQRLNDRGQTEAEALGLV